MYRCNKCGGEIEELGDMASNNPCHCRIDALTSERDRLRADLKKVTAERDNYRELLLSSFYNLQRMLVTMRKRTPNICTDKMDEAMREVADAINRLQGGK